MKYSNLNTDMIIFNCNGLIIYIFRILSVNMWYRIFHNTIIIAYNIALLYWMYSLDITTTAVSMHIILIADAN